MRIRRGLVRVGCLVVLIAAPAAPVAAGPTYLALGTSLSVGVQPLGPGGANVLTDQGYPDQLAAALPGRDLVKLGCPAETTASMISGAGSLCYAPGSSQLDAAFAFLAALGPSVELVTIDMGANDVEVCGSLSGLDPACVNQAFADVAGNLPVILGTLRASGYTGPIVGMNYYNPFVAAWLFGPPDGRQLARESAFVLGLFNDLLTAVYGAFAMPVADVAAAFHADEFKRIQHTQGLPLNVALVCQWTWMCAPPPIGPNIHANATGYGVIAQAFLAVLE